MVNGITTDVTDTDLSPFLFLTNSLPDDALGSGWDYQGTTDPSLDGVMPTSLIKIVFRYPQESLCHKA